MLPGSDNHVGAALAVGRDDHERGLAGAGDAGEAPALVAAVDVGEVARAARRGDPVELAADPLAVLLLDEEAGDAAEGAAGVSPGGEVLDVGEGDAAGGEARAGDDDAAVARAGAVRLPAEGPFERAERDLVRADVAAAIAGRRGNGRRRGCGLRRRGRGGAGRRRRRGAASAWASTGSSTFLKSAAPPECCPPSRSLPAANCKSN